jgi:hypothetical protein
MNTYQTELTKLESVINFLVKYISTSPENSERLSESFYNRHTAILLLFLTKKFSEREDIKDLDPNLIESQDGLKLLMSKLQGSLQESEILEVVKDANSEFCKSVITDMQNTLPDKNFRDFYNKLAEMGLINTETMC